MRECPHGKHTEKVNEIAQISQEIVVSAFVIGVVSDGHEIEQLDRVPYVEVIRISTNQVSTNEDIQDSCDEGELLSQGDSFSISPTLAKVIHAVAHSSFIPFELFIRRR